MVEDALVVVDEAFVVVVVVLTVVEGLLLVDDVFEVLFRALVLVDVVEGPGRHWEYLYIEYSHAMFCYSVR